MKLYMALKKKICSALISSILPSVHMSKTCYRPHHQLVFYKYTQVIRLWFQTQQLRVHPQLSLRESIKAHTKAHIMIQYEVFVNNVTRVP